MEFDVEGRELPDPTPVAIPAGCGQPESLQDTIRRMIRVHMSEFAQGQGAETFFEANDFDIDEDGVEGVPTRYETYAEMQEEVLREPDSEAQLGTASVPSNQPRGSDSRTRGDANRGTGPDSVHPSRGGPARSSQDGDNPDGSDSEGDGE